jgi:hypothetical protein
VAVADVLPARLVTPASAAFFTEAGSGAGADSVTGV